MPSAEKKHALLVKKAEAGDARAQYETGLAYYRGDGVTKDMPTARRWLMKAANQGDRDAQVLLGLRGLHLNQGVEFRFGAGASAATLPSSTSTPEPLAPPAPAPGEFSSEPVVEQSGHELEQGLRDLIQEAQEILSDRTPFKDRMTAALTAMLSVVRSRRMPAKPARRQMIPHPPTVEKELAGQAGIRIEVFKKRLFKLCDLFETIDLKPPDYVKPTPRPMAEDKNARVARLADEIEAELRSLRWWSDTPPTDEEMAFKAAFAMDTMPLAKWIQFVLLPRVREILERGTRFPGRSMVGVHAVREFDGVHEASNLASLLCAFDDAVEA